MNKEDINNLTDAYICNCLRISIKEKEIYTKEIEKARSKIANYRKKHSNTTSKVRICSKCGEEYDIIFFRLKIKNNKEYHSWVCKNCVNKQKMEGYYKRHGHYLEKGLEQRAKNKKKKEQTIKIKVKQYIPTIRKCKICNKFKDISNFKQNKKGKPIAYTCKKCISEKDKKHYLKKKKENPEYFKELTRKWRKRNPERIKTLNDRYREKNRNMLNRRARETFKNPERREKRKKLNKRYRLSLPDRYVAFILGIKSDEIEYYKDIIELKRIKIKIYREIKQQST